MDDVQNIVKNNFKHIDNYINSDPRLQAHSSLLERKLNILVFDKLIKATQGVRKIHYIDYDGSQIPFRLLSQKEEILIKHQTHIEFKQYPEFLGGENHPMFSRIELIKILSKATTPAPEIDEPYLTEDDVYNLPPVAFTYLINEFQKLNQEYNLAYNPNMEDDLSYLFDVIFDGAPINEKKLALLSGLTSSTMLQIIIRLCNERILQEDSIQYATLANDLKTNATIE